MPKNDKLIIFKNRKQLCSKVKDYKNFYLNTVKVDFFDHCQDNSVEVKSVSEVLNELGIDEFEYKRALGISGDNGFELHLKRPTNSCFVNNYFDTVLLAWEVNMDIQLVLNHYKAVTYMYSYLSKQEDECS